MSIRDHSFAEGEFYHCYNRGVDKRVVFDDAQDFLYFLQGLEFYNKESSAGKMRDYLCINETSIKDKNIIQLVKIHAYCLNRNHFHLILEELGDSGISRFMQKLSTSYVMYFNQKNDRSGTLFQGKFKSVHVESDIYMRHLGVYVNLNNIVHGIEDSKDFRSSMDEYTGVKNGICDTTLLSADTFGSYEIYAKKILPDIIARKKTLSGMIHPEFID